MNLFIISGATGMTGNELVRQVLKKGNAVIGFDNFFASSIQSVQDCLMNESFYFFEYDVCNNSHMKNLEKTIVNARNDYEELIYINCAAVVHTEYFYDIHKTFETNVMGMKNFLEQAIRVGASTYINCSTSEVYSMQSWNEGGVKEDDYILLANAEHSQRTSYATGKLLTEFFMKDAVNKQKIVGCSLRFANVYSKNELLSKHIIPHIITSLYQDGKVTLLENSKHNKRTFLHNYDSCAAVLALVETRNALDGSIYNVATEEEVAITELVARCADKLEIREPIITYEGFRESDPQRRVLSTEKIRKRTTWNPQITLSQGLDMCVDYIRKEKEL